MAQKQNFLHAMSTLSPEEVVSMLPKEILDQVVSQNAVSLPSDSATVTAPTSTANAAPAQRRRLKPLNAFIAFRSKPSDLS